MKLRTSLKPLPEIPDKERLLELLDRTHAPMVQNWTMSEQVEMFKALKAVAFLWYRDERFL